MNDPIRHGMSPRELAYSGVFGAAALLLPSIFHVIHLGHVFMPMYLPLVALGFLVRPRPAAVTSFVVPLLSGALSGMPPFYPPIAPTMAFELAIMVALVSMVRRRWPDSNEWAVLAVALLIGRCVNFVLLYSFAKVVQLPAGFVAGMSLLSGWPGILLMLAVVPSLVRSQKVFAHTSQEIGKES